MNKFYHRITIQVRVPASSISYKIPSNTTTTKPAIDKAENKSSNSS